MTKAVALLVMVALVIVAMSASGVLADDCNPDKLAPCLPAIVIRTKPAGACCKNLRSQQGCFCEYAKNPDYHKFITSPKAHHALDHCGVPIPSC
ncbi:hypothetical protein EJB05_52666, partial [Eragrostis curvula]